MWADISLEILLKRESGVSPFMLSAVRSEVPKNRITVLGTIGWESSIESTIGEDCSGGDNSLLPLETQTDFQNPSVRLNCTCTQLEVSMQVSSFRFLFPVT